MKKLMYIVVFAMVFPAVSLADASLIVCPDQSQIKYVPDTTNPCPEAGDFDWSYQDSAGHQFNAFCADQTPTKFEAYVTITLPDASGNAQVSCSYAYGDGTSEYIDLSTSVKATCSFPSLPGSLACQGSAQDCQVTCS